MIHQEAARAAKKLLKELKISKPPIDIRSIIKTLDILVSEVTNDDDGMSGLILRKKGGRSLIGVNASHSENRKRFTLAHELGHYQLHSKDVFVDPEVNFFIGYRAKDRAYNKHESEANSFAAEILMPEEFVRRDYITLSESFEHLDGSGVIHILSTKYDVSYDAMRIRLNNLSLAKA